jgi:hypothetical protein
MRSSIPIDRPERVAYVNPRFFSASSMSTVRSRPKSRYVFCTSCCRPFFFSRPLTYGIPFGSCSLRSTRPTVVLMIFAFTSCTSVCRTS